jgi:hypothetical protein
MHVEIDQSIKVEYTSQATVLAFANGKTYTILISAQVKQRCLEHLRQRNIGVPRRQIRLFSAALFLLLREHMDEITTVTIDREYTGHDSQIKDHLVNLFRRTGRQIEADQIRFGNIGKKAAAHCVTIDTFRGRRKPDRIIGEKELLAEL